MMSGSGSGSTNTSADYAYNAERGITEAFATAFLGSSACINEFSADTYAGIEDSCKDTVGLVFISRAGGEGGDVYTVVVINSCNAMELGELEDDPAINAVISMVTPGAMGFKSLGKILNGTVNPSGRTVDTFVADNKKTPTF